MNYEKLMSRKNSEGKDAVDLLNEASDLIDKEKFNNAADLLKEAISLCGHPRFYFNRGYCHYQMKDSKNAIKDFTKSIANDRGGDLLEHEKQRLYLYLGIVYEDTEEDEKAVDAYKESADLGYEGALARLERMGVTYTPNSKNESSKTEASISKQKQSGIPNPAGAAHPAGTRQAGTASAASALKSSNIKNSSPGGKSKLQFILPIAAGVMCGIGAFILLNHLNGRETSIKPTITTAPIIKAAVKSDILNLRAEPYANAEVLTILFNGYVVEITGDVSGDFTPVDYEGVQGWVQSDGIEKNN
ncbi:MAG: SH3 domain-containing protein [Treponema sp.]|nr:SH3 domain-containing protein [Treponema sp.]